MRNLSKYISTAWIVFALFHSIAGNATVSDPVAAGNAALKKSLSLKPNGTAIIAALAKSNFSYMEKLLKDSEDAYASDPLFESPLEKNYSAFRHLHEDFLSLLNKWIVERPGYQSYLARGIYFSGKAWSARGGEFIQNTPKKNIEEMERFLGLAKKDLVEALHRNANLMPAYIRLISAARALGEQTEARSWLEAAIRNDPRTYYVRFHYLVNLTPRWGGSYEEMDRVAREAIAYNHLNNRLWSLQGERFADEADMAYSKCDHLKAISLYSKALAFGDRTMWFRFRANSYSDVGNYELALQDVRSFLSYSPNDKDRLRFEKQLEDAVARPSGTDYIPKIRTTCLGGPHTGDDEAAIRRRTGIKQAEFVGETCGVPGCA